jgi:hypothetical protein
MSKLSFKLAFMTPEFQELDLPVEVRKPNLALVANTFATKTVEVQPGTYFVSATLPAGQELYTKVNVGSTDAQATLEPEEHSPHESHERQFFMSAGLFAGADRSLLERLSAEVVQASVGLLRGADPRSAIRETLPPPHFEELGKGVQFQMFGSAPGAPQFLEFLRPGKPAIHVALPVVPGQPGLVVVRHVTTGGADDLAVDVHVNNGEADLLLSGLSGGYLHEASQAVNSEQITAEKLLQDKEGDPFGAAVGAYALLQFGELDRLHGWTENLMNWFQWLPDGLPIRGEHLARLGRHQEALRVFAEIPLRGIPQFSIGISYALNRLRIYTSTTRTYFSPEWLARAQGALDHLDQVSRFVDFRRPVTTCRGMRNDAHYPAGPDVGQYL